MALKFVDGFDLEASGDAPVKWDLGAVATGTNGGSTVVSNAITPYNAGQAMQSGWVNFNTGSGQYIRKFLGGNFATLTIGFAFNPGSKPNDSTDNFFGFFDAGTLQMYIHYTATNFFEVCRGNGTVLCTGTSTAVLPNIWYYLELQATFATTAVGSVTLHVNGLAEASATSIITAQSANSYANVVALGQLTSKTSVGNSQYTFDDFYCLDPTGSVNNTFLGIVRVTGLLPSAAGTNTQMAIGGTTPAATNWQSVNQANQDGDVTYVSSATVGQYDTYQYQDLGTNANQVLCVVASPCCRRDDANVRAISFRCRNNSAEADGPQSASLNSQYFWPQLFMDFNPVTGVAWTVPDVNLGEFGPKVFS